MQLIFLFYHETILDCVNLKPKNVFQSISSISIIMYLKKTFSDWSEPLDFLYFLLVLLSANGSVIVSKIRVGQKYGKLWGIEIWVVGWEW